MTIEPGKFQLYTYIEPALKAGAYRFGVTQELRAKGTAEGGTGDAGPEVLKVEALQTHVTIDAPRFQLPPDQVLSTFPPAGTDGSYGLRLPQVVIKRRTLPWERGVQHKIDGALVPAPSTTPWLALVLIADGEAEIKRNVPVNEALSSGRTLTGPSDVPKCTTLVVRDSILRRVLPTQKDVPLLAHAREVDINDTELMMGDDDGFLAVVVANRLPVTGRSPAGTPLPVSYTACLISLEGQFDLLLPEAPPHREESPFYELVAELYVGPNIFDHIAAGEPPVHWADPVVNPVDTLSDRIGGFESVSDVANRAPTDRFAVAPVRSSNDGAVGAVAASTGYANETLVREHIDRVGSSVLFTDPEYRFPVLLHWSFTSSGNEDFEALMRELDSGLLGTNPKPASLPPTPSQNETRRSPAETAETGHVALDHRTRRGDLVRSWYRGPLLPHPSNGERLPIAHASDQLRAVVPDGREDISLATAFEIGRLLALSRPGIVSAMLRWRQAAFQAARTKAIWAGMKEHLAFDGLLASLGANLTGQHVRRTLEGSLRALVTDRPDETIGRYRPLITAGDRIDRNPNTLSTLTQGLGITVELDPNTFTLEDLRNVSDVAATRQPPVVAAGEFRQVVGDTAVAALLARDVDQTVKSLLSNAIGGNRNGPVHRSVETSASVKKTPNKKAPTKKAPTEKAPTDKTRRSRRKGPE